MHTFEDRRDAGQQLSAALSERMSDRLGRPLERPVVLALPRGGVPVAAEVADVLGAPLDVIGVRKVGAPGHPELGVGAVAEGGGLLLDRRTLDLLGIRAEDVAATVEAERREVERRLSRYRGDRPLPDLTRRTVVVVDDGIATGVTVRAAVGAVRACGAERVVVAVPVCSAEARQVLEQEVDDLVCIHCPPRLRSVGEHYRTFAQTTDAEVLAVLAERQPTTGPATPPVTAQEVLGDGLRP